MLYTESEAREELFRLAPVIEKLPEDFKVMLLHLNGWADGGDMPEDRILKISDQLDGVIPTVTLAVDSLLPDDDTLDQFTGIVEVLNNMKEYVDIAKNYMWLDKLGAEMLQAAVDREDYVNAAGLRDAMNIGLPSFKGSIADTVSKLGLVIDSKRV